MKKIIIKAIFSIFSIFSVIFSIITIVQASNNLSYYQNINNQSSWLLMSKESVGFAIGFETYRLFFWIICCISNLFFFLVVNFKSMKFVTVSMVQIIKENKENKKAKLAREIAKKQAKLDELNNLSKTE